MMTIDEAIESRYQRFDRLWEKATGHTFREDEDWCKGKTEEEMPAWTDKLAIALHKYGYSSVEEYREACWSDNSKKVEELTDLFITMPKYSSLFPYEKMCIDCAKSIVDFIGTVSDDIKSWWKEITKDKNTYDLYKALKEKGCDIDPDGNQSGNSLGMCLIFANCLIYNPDLFQYMHGALSPLVGDEGYHDDRSDLPKQEETKEEE